MRIAYICADPGIPVFGCKGASIHIQEIIRSFLRLGTQVELFAARFDGTAPAGLEGVKVHRLPPVGRGDPAYREAVALAANISLTAALQQAGRFDLIYERYSLWSYAGMEFARAAGTPGVLEVNAPLIEEQARHRGLIHRAEAEQVAARVFAAASILSAVSAEAARYAASFDGVDPGRVQIVPNGVDPGRFSPDVRPALERSQNELVVGFVGTLKPWHGLDVLLDGFARFHTQQPASRLLIVGDGPLREALERQAAEYNLVKAVQFTGPIVHDSIPAYLTSMDIAVAPYPDLRDFYFSPLKVFEYMASGRAVVASRIGQINDLLDHGITGLLCQPGDPAALAAAFERLHADSDLRRRLGEAARSAVIEHHTWEAVAYRILDLTGVDKHLRLKSEEPL